MDVKRELAAAVERFNPEYGDMGEYYIGATDTILNDFSAVWAVLGEGERQEIDRQLVALISAPMISPRDLRVLATASRLCGRLAIADAIAPAYRRLTHGPLALDQTGSNVVEARLALFNMVVSLGHLPEAASALTALVCARIIPSDLLPLAFQGYLRGSPLSFSQAIMRFVNDLGEQSAAAPWEAIWRYSGDAVDVGALAVSLKELPILRHWKDLTPSKDDFGWLIMQLFGSTTAPFELRRHEPDGTSSASKFTVTRSVKRRLGPPITRSATLDIPAGSAREYSAFSALRDALDNAVTFRTAEALEAPPDDPSLNVVYGQLKRLGYAQ